mgnify:CR=1 FL=1
MEGEEEHNVERVSSTDSIPESGEATGESSAKRIRRQTSIAWDGFDTVAVTADGRKKVKCKWCAQTYLLKGNSVTSNMLKHFESCKWRELKNTSFGAPLDQHMYREKIAVAIIKHNYPFEFVEHEGIQDLHNFLCEEAKPVSRNTIKADVVRMYLREKETLKHALENVKSRICLTFDLWSSSTTDGYLALTAHYIDENWVLQKRILNFRHIPPPHNGVSLATGVMDLLREWGIEKKIFSLTMDNAAYND